LFNGFIQLHYRVFAFNSVCTMMLLMIRSIKLDPRCTFLKCFL
jgi:hypothetical protein